MWALRAERVFDGRRFVPGGALVFVDGSTVAGVESRGATVPSDCELVEVAGTLLPGLLDTHVHLVGDGHEGALDRLETLPDDALPPIIEAALDRCLSAGITTVRDLGDRRYAVLDWLRAAGSAQRPTVLAAGPPITVPRGHCWNMGGEASGAVALRAAVAERAERGVDVVKVMASGGFQTPGSEINSCQFSAAELACIVTEAHRHGLPVTAHAHPLAAIDQAIAAGVDGIEHCTGLTDVAMPDRGGLPASTVTKLQAGGVVVCPTLGQTQVMTPTPAAREVLAARGLTPELLMRRMGEQATALIAAGVPLVSGSDSGIGAAKPHGIVALSVAALVAAGTPAAVALASVTSIAARALGLGTTKGHIRNGHDADLVVVGGDPGADIAALTDVRRVYLGGHLVRSEN